MKKYWVGALVLALAATFAPKAEAVREYYALSRSVRALGMGGAFYGLSDDEYALFYNPAGLSYVRDSRFNLLAVNAGVSSGTLSAIDKLTKSSSSVAQIAQDLQEFQGKSLYGTAGVNLLSYYRKNFALGILVPDAKFNFAFLGRDLATEVDVTGIADGGVLVGYATDFMNEKLHVGVTGKALVRAGGRKLFTLSDIARKDGFSLDPDKLGGVGGGIDFDLGATYELPLPAMGPWMMTRVSAVLNNLLAPTFTQLHLKGGPPPGTVRQFSLGANAILRGYGPFDHFNVLLDLAEFSLGGESDPDRGARGGSFWKHVNFGVEAPLWGMIIPRAGVHQGYFTAGLGFDLRVVRFDLATYAEELGAGVDRLASRRWLARIQVGWGSIPPAIEGKKDAKPEEKKPEEKKPDAKPEEKKDPNVVPGPVPTLQPDGAPKPTGAVPEGVPTMQPAPPAGSPAPAPTPAPGTDGKPVPQMEPAPPSAAPTTEGPKPSTQLRTPGKKVSLRKVGRFR